MRRRRTMNKYEKPEMTIKKFSADNIITTSGPTTPTAESNAINWLTGEKDVDSKNIITF